MLAGYAEPWTATGPPGVTDAPRQQAVFLGPPRGRSQTESLLDTSRTSCECLMNAPSTDKELHLLSGIQNFSTPGPVQHQTGRLSGGKHRRSDFFLCCNIPVRDVSTHMILLLMVFSEGVFFSFSLQQPPVQIRTHRRGPQLGPGLGTGVAGPRCLAAAGGGDRFRGYRVEP